MTKRAKYAWLTALVIGVVVVGFVVGTNVIGGMSYSRFRTVYLDTSFERGPEVRDGPISAAFQKMIEHELIERGIPYELRDGVLYVRNREWWDEELMADVTWQANRSPWPGVRTSRGEVTWVPLYPERTVLAETALFRERPIHHGLSRLDCVLDYYGLSSINRPGYVRVLAPLLHNAAFLRFAAAKAEDREWVVAIRSREQGCEPVYRALRFTGDGAAAPGEPWPQYSADELAEIFGKFGFDWRAGRRNPDAPPSVAQGLYDEPAVLELIVSQTDEAERVWPDYAPDGPVPSFEELDLEDTGLAETALFRGYSMDDQFPPFSLFDLEDMTPAEAELFRAYPRDGPFADLICVLRYYGVLVSHEYDGIEAPKPVLGNEEFLRFAAAKASDADWLDRVRARHRLCWSGLETVAFEADGAPAADSPWTGYDKGDLTDALSHAGIAHRRPAGAALRVPASLYREPEVLRLLVSGGGVD